MSDFFLDCSRTASALALGLSALGCAHRPSTAPASEHALTPAAATTPAPQPAAPAAAAPAATPTQAPATKLTHDLPTCTAPGEECFAPRAFTEKICKGKYPDLALVLFAKGQPWQHLYVKAEHVEPVNVYAGPVDEQWMFFGEEVIVLSKGQGGATPKGVVQISGPEDVDVLRVDGTCATIRREMLVTYATGAMTTPHVVWKYLEPGMQQALLADKGVQKAQANERKICRSESVTHPEEACAKAMAALTQAVVAAVKQGLTLPMAEKRPEWTK
jgi:hypothetical protein